MTSWRSATAVAGLAVAGVLPLVAPTPASAADELVCDISAVPGSERLGPTDTEANPPHERMGVVPAQELARGRGTTVAVIDSGVEPVGGVREVGAAGVAGGSLTRSAHGTIVAGLIAGKDGVAPEAGIYDVKVFDAHDIEASEGQRVTSEVIARGIEQVVRDFPTHRFDVVNISLAVPTHDPVLAKAVAELVALDTVVVAAAGNKAETVEGFEGTPGSDDEVYPADYPGVLGVSAVPDGGDDPANHVTPNLGTDVAAPTRLAVSVDALGQRCVLSDVATSWASAEVSGVVALLRERFPDDSPQEIVARLEATTEGAGVQALDDEARNPWTGAGVVQAHDALTRQVRFDRRGDLKVSRAEIGADGLAPPAPERVDLFGSSRALLLWSGLVAGALLALAFMLRPLVRRRSRAEPSLIRD